jgi:hypothetical protein
MRSIPLLFVAVFLAALQISEAFPVETNPADHTIEQRTLEPTLASPLWSAKLASTTTQFATDDQQSAKPVESPVAEAPVAKRYTYADAYRSFEKCGKLCVLITTNNCPPCEEAHKWFRAVALSRNSGACIVLHEVDDAAEVADIKEDGAGFPQLIVYHAASGTDVDTGEPSRQVLVGYREISTSGEALAFSRSRGTPKTVATNTSFQKCAGGCDSCPADCAANGCHCGHTQAAQAAGACGGGCGLVLGQPVRNLGRVVVGTARWFDERRPVRKAVKGVASVAARVAAGVARGAARIICPRCWRRR